MSWQPIETAPKDVTVILVYDYMPGSLAYRICYWDEKYWKDYSSGLVIRPTHWMPLPEPPK